MRMFTLTVKDIGKRARAYLPMVICIGFFCYFMLHVAGGDHGLEARDQLSLRVSQLETTLATLTNERKFYEHRIVLLEKGKVSADMADELARKNLQYAHPEDLILFE